jgi:hypothetical protein
VLGTSFWTEFTSIDFRYYHELNLIFYSSFWVDYRDPQTEAFFERYRNNFYNEPLATSRKGMNFGIIGYDMTFYFINALRLKGSRFILALDDYHPGLVQGPFVFSRVSQAGGYENRHINFYQFTPDMEILRLEVPAYPPRGFYFRPIEDKRKRNYLYRELELY